MPGIYYPRAWVQIHLRLEELGQPDPERLITLPCSPIRLTVTRNRWVEADTFEAVVDLEDFPLDARILRGATFEAFLADAESLDPAFWHKLSNQQMRERAVFAGVVDEVETTVDDEWRKTTLKGRDYTAYFLDVEMEKAPVTYIRDKQKLTFVEVIEGIVADHPNASALEVVPDDDVPDLYPADYKLGAGDEKTGSRKKREGETVWEALQEIALEAGFVLYVDLDRIRIRRPRTIFVDQAQDESLYYRFTMGGDLKSLTLKRNMGRQHGFNVRVISYHPDAPAGKAKRLVSIWPKDVLDSPAKAEIEAAEPTETPKTKTRKKVTFIPYVVRGITDQAQLDQIAESLWELLRHHELEGALQTDDLADSAGRNILPLAYGDPIVVDIGESLASILSLSRGEQVRRLLEIGYDQQTAHDVALALAAPRVPFYADQVKHTYDADEGYTLDVEIRSRKQADFETGEDATA